MWTKEKVLQLIKMLHKTPALWDVQSNEYKDRNLKADKVRKIATHLNVSEDKVGKKIKSLKTQFQRERKRKKEFENSGAGTSSPGKEWFHYDMLTFLIENNEPKSSCSTDKLTANVSSTTVTKGKSEPCGMSVKGLPLENESRNDDGSIDSSEAENVELFTPTSTCLTASNRRMELFSQPAHRKKICIKNPNQVMEAYKFMQSIQHEIAKRDAFSVYGENVASRMREAGKSNRAVAIAKHELDTILFKLEMGWFDENPSASGTPSKNSTVRDVSATTPDDAIDTEQFLIMKSNEDTDGD